jgi:hypothetical protein
MDRATILALILAMGFAQGCTKRNQFAYVAPGARASAASSTNSLGGKPSADGWSSTESSKPLVSTDIAQVDGQSEASESNARLASEQGATETAAAVTDSASHRKGDPRIAFGQETFLDDVMGADASLSMSDECREDVRRDFAALQQALLDQDAPAASRLVTASTLEFYEVVRRLALDSSSVDLEDVDQLMVLFIFQTRYLLSRVELEGMTGSQLFEWGVSSGQVDKAMLATFGIYRVQQEGDVAYCTVTQHGQVTPDGLFIFRKEGEHWRLDLQKIMRMANEALDSIRLQAGKTKIEFAVFMLERTHDQKIPPAILDGPLRENPRKAAAGEGA